MKNFIKLILIFLITFFSLGINRGQAEYISAFSNQQCYSVPSSEAKLFEAVPNSDTAIASSNSNNFEIIAQKNDTDSGNLSTGNCCSHNNFYSHYLKVYSNKTINNKSHNISSYLKNEICARAP